MDDEKNLNENQNEQNSLNDSEKETSISNENTEEVKEEKSLEKEETKKESVLPETNTQNNAEKGSIIKKITENNILKKILIIIIVLLIIIIGGKTVYNKFVKNDNISGVKKVLSTKYTSISCIDYDCDGFIAIDGDKLSKYKTYLYDSNGKKVAEYKVKYNKDDATTEVPKEIGDGFYISSTVSVKNLKSVKYSIKNKRGKTIYETKNELSVINANLISMKDDKVYTILDKKGKEVYSNISDINTYADGKYVEIKVSDSYTILNEKGEKILSNYKMSKCVTDENGKELFAILRNSKESSYNYYSFSKKEIIGDSFNSYTESDEEYEFIITKKENDKTVKYTLSKDGKQTKLESSSDIVKQIEENIDSDKYTLYDYSVYDENQKNVLVDDKTNKSFGLLNLKSKKFTALYNYKSGKSYIYSTVTKISKEEDNAILKISCSDSYCDSKTSIIYDMKNNKTLYKSEGVLISDYKEYDGGYKVVGFSSDKTNKYGSKNVVFDKSNKELEVSNDDILIVDKKLKIGEESNYSVYLYSTKSNKIVNKNLVKRVEVEDKVVYKYTDDNDNTIILDSNGNEVIKINDDDYIDLNGDHYVYIKDNVLYTYNIIKEKTYKYKLKDNEKLNDASGSIITPYKNAIFVNNSSDKYIKVLNFKGNQIKKIKNVEISSVKTNEDKAFIIVKKTTNDGSLYGLYVAE